jgi:hypothetical protein
MKDMSEKIEQFTDSMILNLWETLDAEDSDMYYQLVMDKWLDKYLEDNRNEDLKYSN